MSRKAYVIPRYIIIEGQIDLF